MLTDPDFEAFIHDHSDANGLATSKFVILRGVKVLEAPDTDFVITDGSGGNEVERVPANTAAGTWIESGEVKLVDGAYVDDNSATAGKISIRAKKYVKGA